MGICLLIGVVLVVGFYATYAFLINKKVRYEAPADRPKPSPMYDGRNGNGYQPVYSDLDDAHPPSDDSTTITQDVTHPSYEEIHQGCVELVKQIKKAGKIPDIIIGLVRGGMIPAVIISHLLGDVPVIAAHYSSTTGNGDNKNHSNTLPPVDIRTNILIVDDIVDSGNTLKEVYMFYWMWINDEHNVNTACLYYKDNKHHIPNFSWRKIAKDSPWIIFPFEKE